MSRQALLSLTINAPYSASLLDVEKPKWTACSSTRPSGDTSTILASEPLQLEAPSTNNSHFSLPELNWVSGRIHGTGSPRRCWNSTMKSARTYPLMAVRGLYLMSNDPNCTPYLVILSEKSNLCNNILRWRSVNRVTVLASK